MGDEKTDGEQNGNGTNGRQADFDEHPADPENWAAQRRNARWFRSPPFVCFSVRNDRLDPEVDNRSRHRAAVNSIRRRALKVPLLRLDALPNQSLLLASNKGRGWHANESCEFSQGTAEVLHRRSGGCSAVALIAARHAASTRVLVAWDCAHRALPDDGGGDDGAIEDRQNSLPRRCKMRDRW